MKNENKKYIIVFIKVFPYQYMALPVYTKENIMSAYTKMLLLTFTMVGCFALLTLFLKPVGQRL